MLARTLHVGHSCWLGLYLLGIHVGKDFTCWEFMLARTLPVGHSCWQGLYLLGIHVSLDFTCWAFMLARTLPAGHSCWLGLYLLCIHVGNDISCWAFNQLLSRTSYHGYVRHTITCLSSFMPEYYQRWYLYIAHKIVLILVILIFSNNVTSGWTIDS